MSDTLRIDAHQHYWKLAWSEYPWMQPLAAIRRDYGPDDLSPLLQAAGVGGTVLVQADATERESDRLIEVARQTPSVLGVVGWVDLAARDAVAQVERRAAQSAIRGLRPMLEAIADSDWILQPGLKPALQAMAAAGLRFDALIQPRHLKAIAALIERHPGLPVAIDHGGKPDLTAQARGTSAFRDWRDGMRALAAHPHLHCKLSGLLTQASPSWTADAILPAAEALLELFGPQRLIWGSDWPVMTLNGTYQQWVEISERVLRDLAPDDRAAVWGGNAVRFYGLDTDGAP
jgi:L-fuconolactonase